MQQIYIYCLTTHSSLNVHQQTEGLKTMVHTQRGVLLHPKEDWNYGIRRKVDIAENHVVGKISQIRKSKYHIFSHM